jgi:hypothetical protein
MQENGAVSERSERTGGHRVSLAAATTPREEAGEERSGDSDTGMVHQ